MDGDADLQSGRTRAERNQAADEWLQACGTLHAALREPQTSGQRWALTRKVAQLFGSVLARWGLDAIGGETAGPDGEEPNSYCPISQSGGVP